MYTLINRLKKVQKQSGNQARCKHIWRKINNLNKQIANDTISRIMKMAEAYRIDIIVFEHLHFTGQKKPGALVKTQRWAKQTIQEKVKHKAHVLGMRMNRVNARNTSALAYDGSGKVKRLGTNASLCIFTNNKPYHSDLNASYNIGARYFIQSILKSLTVTEELAVQAKVPELQNRTNCTLSTLRALLQVA
jgi:putative transposase